MKEVSIEEKKQISLTILDEIDIFCKRNNIRYYLNYGTLLGAVRHKGYIPWDDDIDIGMPRPDYEKFLNFFSSEKFKIANYRNKKYYPIYFSKVFDPRTDGILYGISKLHYGVAVDIFPLEGYSSSVELGNKLFRKYNVLNRLYGISISYRYTKNPIKFLIKGGIHILFSPYLMAKKIDKLASKYSYDDSLFVGNLLSSDCSGMLEKNNFSTTMEMDFENKKYLCPSGYKNWLINMYGEDYMTPPPENMRISNHDEKYYWIES